MLLDLRPLLDDDFAQALDAPVVVSRPRRRPTPTRSAGRVRCRVLTAGWTAPGQHTGTLPVLATTAQLATHIPAPVRPAVVSAAVAAHSATGAIGTVGARHAAHDPADDDDVLLALLIAEEAT